MRYFRSAIWLFMLSSLAACLNPLKKIEPDIEASRSEASFTTVETPRGPLYVASTGMPKNPPLLFVHGSPGSWEGWASYLRDKNLQRRFHLLAVDRPGYGGSSPGQTEPSLQNQGEAIFHALDLNRSGKPAILIGHSMGGPIIARMAMDRPEKAGGLIFLAASVDPSQEHTKWYQYAARWWIFRWMVPRDLKVCNEEILALKNQLQLMQPLWPKITAPSVILQGDKDDLVAPANLDFLLRNLNGKLIVNSARLPETNHFFIWDRPELVLKAIDDVTRFQKEGR
jgi:pimeloyl-ACP methyl ester carboxylesterase